VRKGKFVKRPINGGWETIDGFKSRIRVECSCCYYLLPFKLSFRFVCPLSEHNQYVIFVLVIIYQKECISDVRVSLKQYHSLI
jgi:hypothetical protein